MAVMPFGSAVHRAGLPLALLIIGRAPLGVEGQFGGPPRPAPNCPLFKCPAGQKPVGKLDYQTWSYGCKDAGFGIQLVDKVDPSNPHAGAKNKKSVDRCCVERDICKQTCGMTPKACHDNYQKCQGKICKGDQSCELQALMSEMMSDPFDLDESKKPGYKYDPEAQQCRGYNRGQESSCECVAEDEWQGATEAKLKAFYGKFNPEKLSKKGEIKDIKDVWKKWKGKEPDMFLALTTKYKDKAVEIRELPKRDYSKEDPLDASAYEPSGEDIPLDEPYEPPEPAAAEKPAKKPAKKTAEKPDDASLDEDDKAYDKKIKELVAKKKKAAADEEYELADEAKQEAAAATEAEVKRLKALKAKAIEEENFAEAKRVKQRLQKVEL